MKSLIVKLTVVRAAFIGSLNVQAQIQTDPLLMAAVGIENATLKKQLEKQNEKQLAIIGINTGIMVQLDSIRKYETIMHDYLSKAQNIVNNAYDVYKCGDLTTQIYSNLRDCTNAAVGHPEGAIVSAVVSKQYSKIADETMSLYGYIAGLVKKSDGSVLLNSMERTSILAEVRSRLATINRNLVSLKWQIKLYRWADIPRLLAPKEYYMFIDGEAIVKSIKRDIDRMSR